MNWKFRNQEGRGASDAERRERGLLPVAGVVLILGAGSVAGVFAAHGLAAQGTAPARSAALTSVSRRAAERVPVKQAAQAPGIGIRVTSSTGDFRTVGARVTFFYEVTNTGSGPLNSVIATDSRFGMLSCPQAELASGARMVCTASHVISAADLARGNLANTATVTAVTPDGQQVTGSTTDSGLLPEVSVTG
jgi:hypothetical protein